MHTQITPETRALLQDISEDLNAILATIEGCCKCNVEPGEFGSPEIQQDILDARWIARERIDRIQKILEGLPPTPTHRTQMSIISHEAARRILENSSDFILGIAPPLTDDQLQLAIDLAEYEAGEWREEAAYDTLPDPDTMHLDWDVDELDGTHIEWRNLQKLAFTIASRYAVGDRL